MKLSLEDLKTFSSCPVAFCFSNKDKKPTVTEREKIFHDVVCKAMLQITETSFRADWRRIVGWVDEKVFRKIDVADEDQFKAAKRNSEYILVSLNKWYKDIYLEWTAEAFIGIPLESERSGVIIRDKAPIISLQDSIMGTYISNDVHRNKKEYKRDMKIRGFAWLISEQLKCDIVTVQCLSLKKKGYVDINSIEFDQDSLYRTGTYIENMCKVIKKKYFYPSVSEKCFDCKYYSRCNL